MRSALAVAGSWPEVLRHPVSGPVRHGGTAGKGVWRRVVDRAGRMVPALFADEAHRLLR